MKSEAVSWFSLTPYAGADYFPTWMELAISLFLLTLMVVLFGLCVKYMPVFLPTKDSSS